MAGSVLDILRLGRVHTALVTAAIPSLGCLAAGGGLQPVLLVALGSMFHHAWGFSLNEIMDLDVDRRNPSLSDKPLVAGHIGKREAHLISIVFLLLSFILFGVASYFFEGPVHIPLLFLLGSTLCGVVYDVWGKRFPLSDVFMAGWMFLLVMAASSVSSGTFISSGPVWAVALIGGMQILFNNSVEGGLKDVANDRDSGTRTLAVVCGARLDRKGLRPGKVLRWWGISLRIISVVLAAVFSLLVSMENGWHHWIVILVSILGIVVFLNSLSFLSNRPGLSRKALMGTFAKHEMISFVLLILVVLPSVGPVPSAIVLVAPFIWFGAMNRSMYGSRIVPGV